MTGHSLPTLLDALHGSVEQELQRARTALGHPTDKGDASEDVWIELFNRYLPRRYEAKRAHVVDSQGAFSQQMDVVIHDRQYSPLVFTFKDSFYVPAESVYAVFEARQTMSDRHIAYAQEKIASVRKLHRTSIPVPTVDGLKKPKVPGHILGGLLTLTSDWKPPLGDTMLGHLRRDQDLGRLDLGCVANAGWFVYDLDVKDFAGHAVNRSATRFLFEFIARLQELATVPMLDVRAYGHRL